MLSDCPVGEDPKLGNSIFGASGDLPKIFVLLSSHGVSDFFGAHVMALSVHGTFPIGDAGQYVRTAVVSIGISIYNSAQRQESNERYRIKRY